MKALVAVPVLLWLIMWRLVADAWINGGPVAGILATLLTLGVGAVGWAGVREILREPKR